MLDGSGIIAMGCEDNDGSALLHQYRYQQMKPCRAAGSIRLEALLTTKFVAAVALACAAAITFLPWDYVKLGAAVLGHTYVWTAFSIPALFGFYLIVYAVLTSLHRYLLTILVGGLGLYAIKMMTAELELTSLISNGYEENVALIFNYACLLGSSLMDALPTFIAEGVLPGYLTSPWCCMTVFTIVMFASGYIVALRLEFHGSLVYDLFNKY